MMRAVSVLVSILALFAAQAPAAKQGSPASGALHSRKLVYDAQGRVEAVVGDDGVRTSLRYDDRGRLATVERTGYRESYRYDRRGFVAGLDEPAGRWAITVDGSSHTVRYGRIGTDGQQKTKELGDEDEAQEDADRLIAEKTGKGCEEV